MNRRREMRFLVNQVAEVVCLDEAGRTFTAVVTNVSLKGLALRTSVAAPVGAPVEVTVPQALILGEVCHCSRTAEGHSIGIEVSQVLTRADDLESLINVLSPRQTNLGMPAAPTSKVM